MPVQLASADAVNALVHLLDEVKPIAQKTIDAFRSEITNSNAVQNDKGRH